MANTEADIRNIVNASGFVLQLAVEHVIERAPNCRVHAREHPWIPPGGPPLTPRFIDFVAEKSTIQLVVEVKRPRGGEYVFIVEPGEAQKSRFATVCLSRQESGTILSVGWGVWEPEPWTPRSAFCVLRGATDDQRPMLEKTAAELVLATESVASDPAMRRGLRSDHVLVFVPMIVTTADLWMCEVEASEIDISDGTAPSAPCTNVEYIRFEKAFGVGGERTVFVVNAAHLGDFLKRLGTSDGGRSPWS